VTVEGISDAFVHVIKYDGRGGYLRAEVKASGSAVSVSKRRVEFFNGTTCIAYYDKHDDKWFLRDEGKKKILEAGVLDDNGEALER
jgi:hypothetical protein